MSFIAGEILHVVENEELAFWLFAGLIDKHNLQMLFAQGLPAVHLHMHVLGGLLQENLPELDQHLKSLHASWDMFSSKLVMTLCASYIPLDCLAYVYDVFFMVRSPCYPQDGWVGLYKIIISFLAGYQTELCARDLSGISEYLRKIKDSFGPAEMKQVLRRAVSVSISQKAVETLIDGFFRAEALRLLAREEGSPRRPQGAEANDWTRGDACARLLGQSLRSIKSHRSQYQQDVQHYEAKLSALGLRLGR